MKRTTEQLRRDALAIFAAGVDAVRADRAVANHMRIKGRSLQFGAAEDARPEDLLDQDPAHEPIDLDAVRRILVVGAGKAGAAMATGFETALGERLAEEKQLSGWINVPEGSSETTRWIHLHTARPISMNEPTVRAAAGAEEILRKVASLEERDLCVVLLSGGGSALLPAPIAGVSLEDKIAVTRRLSAAGANIVEMNVVRSALSRIKGGGLAQACRAGRIVTLILSDVLGDSLQAVASGPTLPTTSGLDDAVRVLTRYGIVDALRDRLVNAMQRRPPVVAPTSRTSCHVVANNALAVDAAGMAAERLGYSHAMLSAAGPEGPAEGVATQLVDMGRRMLETGGPDCLISGGEPVVRLADESVRGRGGRNQQLVLAALIQLAGENTRGITLLSAGTDGEDGPTDAAGAIVDNGVLRRALEAGADLAASLARNDAYPCLERLGALIRTGPTGTNVCDLRVVLVERIELSGRKELSSEA